MASNNAFWREVIDYLPKLVLVFRIVENEHAQLIFCNNEIRNQLGYSAREYVLASEEEGKVKQEIEQLVDEVAKRSHDVDSITPRPCKLTDKEGQLHHYNIDFRLYRTKSGGAQLINVELIPFDEEHGEQQVNETKESTEAPVVDTSNFFVCESQAMQSAWNTIKQVCRQTDRHLLLRGETGVGKKAAAEQALRLLDPEKLEVIRWNFDEGSGKPEKKDWEEAKEAGAQVLIRIQHVDKMDQQEQEALLELLKRRGERQGKTRIFATSRIGLDNLVEEGAFNAGLYYKIGFQSVLIPPLRHRKEDVREATLQFVRHAAKSLQLSFDNVPDKELKKLESQSWDRNFHQLYSVLRRSMLEADGDRFKVRLKEKKKFQLFPEQQIAEDEVLGFDEMNRRYLERILQLTDGKIYGDDGAAALLDLKPTTLQSKLKRLGIK